MHITISRHAAERALERGITEEGIRAIVDDVGTTSIIRPSKKDRGIFLVFGMYNGNVWNVVFDPYTDNVVTVRRANKGEVKFYESQT